MAAATQIYTYTVTLTDKYQETNQSETSSVIAPTLELCNPVAEIIRIGLFEIWPLDSSKALSDALMDNKEIASSH